MNQALSDFRSYIKGKRVALIGMGISNASTVDFLLSCGAILTARDQKTDLPGREEWEAKGVRTVTGDGYLDDLNEDLLLKSPGIRPDVPEIADAVGRGTVLESEIGLFCRLCPCPIYAVTGSDGKTTTTTLISRFLEEERKNTDRRVFLGGNIGTPLLCRIEEVRENDAAVLELSSFQLMAMTGFSPHAAVITNVTPNHLNWHSDMAEYTAAKQNIYRFQHGGRLVVNEGNAVTRAFSSPNAETWRFSFRGKTTAPCVYCENETICCCDGEHDETILDRSDILLRGDHNAENYMAAIAATYGEVSRETVVSVARSFAGVPHRCELIREKDGIKFYNSSIDSSPTRTMAALSVFSEPLVVLCGGYDKKIPLEPMIPLLAAKAQAVVVTGQTGKTIEKLLRDAGFSSVSYYPAFDDAARAAFARACPGDSVLLSPAAASFDAFRNFEERGNHFRDLVMAL